MRTFILTIFVFIITIQNTAFAQTWSVGVGLTTKSSYLFDFDYLKDSTITFQLGLTSKEKKAQGKEVDQQLPNYGRTVDGTGDYYSTVDFGVGYFLNPKIWLTGEISIGTLNSYTQYLDRRFTDDHYYMGQKEPLFGIGGTIGFLPNQNFVLFIRLNTVNNFGFGARYIFRQYY